MDDYNTSWNLCMRTAFGIVGILQLCSDWAALLNFCLIHPDVLLLHNISELVTHHLMLKTIPHLNTSQKQFIRNSHFWFSTQYHLHSFNLCLINTARQYWTFFQNTCVIWLQLGHGVTIYNPTIQCHQVTVWLLLHVILRELVHANGLLICC